MIVLHRAWQVGLGKIFEERGCLGRYKRGWNHVGLAAIAELLPVYRVIDCRLTGEVTGALRLCGYSCILIERRRTALATESQKDCVFAARLRNPRQIGRAHEGESEAVSAGGWLLLRLSAQGEGFRVECRVAASPENGAMRLTRIEASEIAAAASAKSAEAAAWPAEASTGESAEIAASATLGAHGFNGVSHSIHVDAGHRADRAGLPRNGH